MTADDLADDGPPDGDTRPDPRDVIADGRRRVTGPAALLVATVVLLLGVVFTVGLQYGLLTAQFDRQRVTQEAQIDANPTMTPVQKAQAKQFMGRMYQGVALFLPVMAVVHIAAAGAVGHGAYRMLTLTSRGWAVAGAVVALVPCFVGYVWVIGLPAGVWALVVLNRRDVKAAFRAARRERDRDLGIDID